VNTSAEWRPYEPTCEPGGGEVRFRWRRSGHIVIFRGEIIGKVIRVSMTADKYETFRPNGERIDYNWRTLDEAAELLLRESTR
jgi:hypothetical protein